MNASSALPDRPDLDQLRRRARELARQVAANSPEAIDRLRRWHPRFAEAASDRMPSVTLRDTQLVVAREHGFDGWAGLRTAVERAQIATDPVERWPGDRADLDILYRAFAQARRLGHAHCSVEHVLLALLAPPAPTIAHAVLTARGLTTEMVLEGVETAVRAGDTDTSPPYTSSTPALHTVLGLASGMALAAGAPQVTDEHVLVVLCYEDVARTPDLLTGHGLDRDDVVADLADRGVDVPPLRPPQPGSP